MFRRFQGFTVMAVLIVLFLAGCSQEMGDDLQLENQKLRSRVKELELMVDEKDEQIERYKKEYELRNIMDIKVRQLLSALDSGIFSETEEDLLNENVIIEEDRLVFYFENHSNIVLFFQNKLDFEKVRQRFYCLDEQGRFITGYEFYMLSDDIEGIGDRGVLIFTFIEEPSGWKIADIGTDR